ncbi:MAG TPA: radical SAM protein [Dehalococcoidia bacterium]|nr:radical SAM protein [Dehalococcoidia bacterium]
MDLVSTEGKTCSFDCIYCQLGRTIYPQVERREFVTMTQLTRELEEVKNNVVADYVTFSGMAEPTLASNLGEAIRIAKSILSVPVAILTNSSLMPREDVCSDLAQADVVVAKIDAANEHMFRQINNPVVGYSFDQILYSIEDFRKSFKGKLDLQMMFISINKNYASQMADIARQISPDEVQLNTPLRPCPVKPLTPEAMAIIKNEFTGLRVVNVYQGLKPEVMPLNLEETLRRRPKL